MDNYQNKQMNEENIVKKKAKKTYRTYTFPKQGPNGENIVIRATSRANAEGQLPKKYRELCHNPEQRLEDENSSYNESNQNNE